MGQSFKDTHPVTSHLFDMPLHPGSHLLPLRASCIHQLGLPNKLYRRGGLNNRHFFLTVLEVEKSNIKVWTDVVLGEGSLSGL